MGEVRKSGTSLKILVLTHSCDWFKPVADITIPVMRDYCERHGYHFHTDLNNPHEGGERHIVWRKISLIREFLNKDFDWVVYFDADVLITNHLITLESFIDNSADIILSEDRAGLNAGVIFVKNCYWSKLFFEEVWNISPGHPVYKDRSWNDTQAEQRAIDTMKKEVRGANARMLVLPQRYFNSYLYREYGEARQEGNFVEGESFALHLPALSLERRVEIFSEYKNKIVR